MRLLITIVMDSTADKVAHALTEKDFRVTGIASTGSLFRRGYTTLLVGVEQGRIDEASETIRETILATREAIQAQKDLILGIKIQDFERY